MTKRRNLYKRETEFIFTVANFLYLWYNQILKGDETEMKIDRLVSVYSYRSERSSWSNIAPREHHVLAYQQSGCYEHTVGDRVLTFSAGTVAFINNRDTYYVRNRETGTSLCITVDATDAPSTFAVDCGDNPHILGLFRKLYSLRTSVGEAENMMKMSVLYELLAEIYKKNSAEYMTRDTAARVRLARDHMLANCLSREVLTEEAAKLCGVGVKQFRSLFKKQYGTTPTQYMIDVRLGSAAELLSNGGLSVAEAAEAVGFSDAGYFSRLFKRRYLVSPGRYGQG